MATLIFDFDHTLFDTKKTRVILDEFFLSHGVPKEKLTEVEKKHREANNDIYDFLLYISQLRDAGYAIPEKSVEKFFALSLEDSLKGPVQEVLSHLAKKGHFLVLLTKGVENFQHFKIKQSGIKHHFGDHIYYCLAKKEEAIEKIPLKDQVYFINDNADEIESVAKKFPHFHFIYVTGPKTSHDRFIDKKHIPTLNDISSLPDLIK